MVTLLTGTCRRIVKIQSKIQRTKSSLSVSQKVRGSVIYTNRVQRNNIPEHDIWRLFLTEKLLSWQFLKSGCSQLSLIRTRQLMTHCIIFVSTYNFVLVCFPSLITLRTASVKPPSPSSPDCRTICHFAGGSGNKGNSGQWGKLLPYFPFCPNNPLPPGGKKTHPLTNSTHQTALPCQQASKSLSSYSHTSHRY